MKKEEDLIWEITDLSFEPEGDSVESYGFFEVTVGENEFIIDNISFNSRYPEITVEHFYDILEESIPESIFEQLDDDDFELMAEICTKNLEDFIEDSYI